MVFSGSAPIEAQCMDSQSNTRFWLLLITGVFLHSSTHGASTEQHQLPQANVSGFQYFIPGEGEGLVTFNLPAYHDGNRTHIAHMTFGDSTTWNVGAMRLANTPDYLDSNVDLTEKGSRSVQFDYRATSDFYVQLRPADKKYWNGGEQWSLKLPATGGLRQTFVALLDGKIWSDFPFGEPKTTFEWVLSRAGSFVFVGNTLNEVTFYDIAIESYFPAPQQK